MTEAGREALKKRVVNYYSQDSKPSKSMVAKHFKKEYYHLYYLLFINKLY